MTRGPGLRGGRRAMPGGTACRWGDVASSPDDAAVTAALQRAWPETLSDPVNAAAYAAALEGIDRAAVETAVATLGAKGRPAPPPSILRSVVLSWQQAAATTVAAGAVPAAAAAPRARPRASTLIPMAAVGALLLAASALTRGTWMTIADAHRAVSFSGGGVRGGAIVALAGPLAALVALAGAFMLWRGRPAAHLRPVLGLLALAGVAAVYGAMTGVMRVSVLANRLDFDLGVAQGTPAGLGPVVAVSTGGALWAALALALVATVAAGWGLLALRRA